MSHQSELIASDILGYLKQHENKELLRLLTCGSVDDGKSTLIGRLLYDTKLVFEDQLAELERDSKKHGTVGEEIDLLFRKINRRLNIYANGDHLLDQIINTARKVTLQRAHGAASSLHRGCIYQIGNRLCLG